MPCHSCFLCGLRMFVVALDQLSAAKKNKKLWYWKLPLFFCLFFGPLALARRVLWIRVCPSFPSSIFFSFSLEVFLELVHKFFLKLNMVLEAQVVLCVIEPDFFGGKSLPKKWAQNRVLWIYLKIKSSIFSEFGLLKKLY